MRNTETPETDNGASTSEDLEGIKAELEEEKKAKAAAEAALAEKDARIAELNASLNVALQGSEAAAAELTAAKQAKDQAVSKYLEAARALNSTIPQDVISGQTIEEIDASVEKAQGHRQRRQGQPRSSGQRGQSPGRSTHQGRDIPRGTIPQGEDRRWNPAKRRN